MRGSESRRRRLLAAWACSAALHALVILLLARTSWVAIDEAPSAQVAVVWIGDLRTPDLAPPRAEPDLAPPPDPDADPPQDPETMPPLEAEPDEARQAEAAPEPESEPEPQRPPEDEPPSEPEPLRGAETESAPTAPAPDAPVRLAPEAPVQPGSEAPADRDAEEPARRFIVREADLEEAWRRAREELEQEQNYLTFSLDDVTEAPLPEEPGPSESIFEAAERFRGSGGPSILAPNKARTRVGRALAEFCNALTGGFGVSLGGLNLGSVCADPQESAKLFAHLKPAYLRSRPLCAEVEPAGGVSGDTAPTIKCRLVLEEEIDQLPVE